MACTKSNTAATRSPAVIGFEVNLWLPAWAQHSIHHFAH
jgi:hypothetical protein